MGSGIALARLITVSAQIVEKKAAREMAVRVHAMVWVYPIVVCLMLLGSGLFERATEMSVVSVGFAAALAHLRRVFARSSDRLPLKQFLRGSVLLGVAATLQIGLTAAVNVALTGLRAENFIFLLANISVASGGTANLAPNRTLQLGQLVSLVAPTTIAMIFCFDQNTLNVSLELSQAAYLGFMTVVGRRIHLDYILGVTQQVRLEADAEELKKARAFAEDSNRAKGEFLANMSHEIRTPLNGVLGMAQVLATSELTNEQRELVSTIVESGEGLLTVLNDVLDFSKIENRKLTIEAVTFSPAIVARQVGALFEHTAKVKGLSLDLRLSNELPAFVRADSLRVRQVLLNITSNALKFTERGGVTLQVDFVGGELVCAVRDSGPGMSPDTVERLFQPFTQGDASTTRRFGGTGLGLAISHQLAQLMGGSLVVESVVGVGSCFTLRIPAEVASQVEVPHAPQRIGGVAVGKRPRVLVAEDNVVNQRVAVKLLEKLGCEAHLANDGAEALRRLEGEQFDLVLMDCQMPEVDGYQATRAIRERELGAVHQAIVGMTASAIDGDKERALASGMDGYLTKPVKLGLLEEVIDRYCRATERSA